MSQRRTIPLVLLLVLLAAEFLLVVGLTLVLLFELLVAPADSVASAVALLLLTAAAACWLGAILVGAWRGRAWVRGASLVWQVLQLGVGIAALQGIFAQPAWGWPLIAGAVLALVLLLSTPVTNALAQRDDD